VNQATLREVQREYARLAGEYDRRWSRYILGTTHEIVRRLSLRAGDRLLDLGCGTGVLLEQVRTRWRGARAVGVDLSAEMLAEAQRRLGTETLLVQGDVSHLPFPARSFDVIVSNSSLHYWPDPELALAEAARVLRVDGRLVLTDISSAAQQARTDSIAVPCFLRQAPRRGGAAEPVTVILAVDGASRNAAGGGVAGLLDMRCAPEQIWTIIGRVGTFEMRCNNRPMVCLGQDRGFGVSCREVRSIFALVRVAKASKGTHFHT
jgi:ubiquinone/menaquinone biosynthesis C-methylase UbiE